MQAHEFSAHLRSHPAFADLAQWQVTPVGGGLVSAHASRFRHGDADYFVKELKDNERDVLQQLVPLRLVHVLRVVYPELLDQNILVADFVAGGTITTKALDPCLVRDYATIQNRVLSAPPGERDRAFYRDSVTHWWDGGRTVLDRLSAEHGWPILDGWRQVAALLAPDTPAIAHEFGQMPFARVHHDLREENILAGPPQVIADWGSSYGAGPFLFDLAPFCLGSLEALSVFTEHSDICRAAGAGCVSRWQGHSIVLR